MYAKLIAYNSLHDRDCVHIPVLLSQATQVREDLMQIFYKVDIAKISEDVFNVLLKKNEHRSVSRLIQWS